MKSRYDIDEKIFNQIMINLVTLNLKCSRSRSDINSN